MTNFVHESPGARVVFGTGQVVEAAGEARRLGRRVLLVCDQIAMPVADRLASALDSDAVGMIASVRQHVPVADAQAARSRARELDANCVLAVGGGSTLGLAKAIALTEKVPIVAVPTTYAGSEMTPVWGLTDGGVKTTGRDPVVAPRTVIYDPELTYGLPPDITAASGLNAIAHCVDSLWAPGRTPLTDAIAERGIASLAPGLAAAVRDGRDRVGRENALIGAWLAGATFAVAGSSLHHKLCHILGGKYDLPHAETHAAVLPYVIELLLPAAPCARQVLIRALDCEDPVDGIRALAGELGAPSRLGDLGLTEAQAIAVAESTELDALDAPRPLDRSELRILLTRATSGD